MWSYELYGVVFLRSDGRREGRTAARRSRIMDMAELLHGEAADGRGTARNGDVTRELRTSAYVRKAGGTAGTVTAFATETDWARRCALPPCEMP
ncbi:hypothetical protein GCM10010394_40960 [Streptomyces crystallinus]|uniref:Uncharacterized protein n=1 Tax=Streptomyces crystallinus TaxID=68191 RepID=A0ABP3RG53_9ACTN